ncbi:MAG: alpha/beta hydrolase [Nitrococcus mobilis]|nr:alpha/beta hydrolase [Nitrococcus mobilis]
MAVAANNPWRSTAAQCYLDMDCYRRWLGAICDAFGLGAAHCAHEVVETGTPACCYRYPTIEGRGPVVVLVPAPIKSADIWDMTPSVSVVRRYLEAGCRVYLVIWPRFANDHGELGLSDYVDSMLLRGIDAVCAQTGADRIHLAGHSIGGLLAGLFAARYPERIRGLTVLSTPLHFGPDIGALGRLVSLIPDTRALINAAEAVPGSLLNILSAAASPQTFIFSRGMDFLSSFADPARMRMHLLVERWTLDETAMPRRLFLDLIDRLYRDDAFAAGRLRIGGKRISPRDIVAPITCVVDRDCDIVPPESILPVLARMGTQDRELFWYHGDRGVSLRHVGMLVGERAHRELWPRLVARSVQGN